MSGQYPVQNDEQFIEKIRSMTLSYFVIFAMSLVITWDSLKVLVPSLHDGQDLGFAVPMFIVAIALNIFFIVMALSSIGSSCFITTKRVYMRTNSNDPYVGIAQEDVKELKAKLCSIRVTLQSDTVVKLKIHKKLHKKILNVLK